MNKHTTLDLLNCDIFVCWQVSNSSCPILIWQTVYERLRLRSLLGDLQGTFDFYLLQVGRIQINFLTCDYLQIVSDYLNSVSFTE